MAMCRSGVVGAGSRPIPPQMYTNAPTDRMYSHITCAISTDTRSRAIRNRRRAVFTYTQTSSAHLGPGSNPRFRRNR